MTYFSLDIAQYDIHVRRTRYLLSYLEIEDYFMRLKVGLIIFTVRYFVEMS